MHGNTGESRAYFDERGPPIWEVYRFASDLETHEPDIQHAPYEAPPTPIELPTEVRNPSKMFDAPPSCVP